MIPPMAVQLLVEAEAVFAEAAQLCASRAEFTVVFGGKHPHHFFSMRPKP